MALRRGHQLVRPATSTVLVMLATVLLVPAAVANWARAEVYDEGRFTDHAVAALDEQPVRDALVAEIVDQIVSAGPSEALAVRPLIELVTDTVLDSQTFRRIYRESVEDVHRRLFEGSSSEPVALGLVDAMIVVSSFIEQAYPEVSAELSPNLSSAFIELRGRDWAVQTVEYAEGLQYLAYLLPVVVVLLYATALFISRSRRYTVVIIGVGGMIAGVSLIAGRSFVRGFALDRTPFEDPAVAEVFWDTFTQSMTGWAFLVGGLGLLVALLGTGRTRRVDVRAQVEAARWLLSYTPATQVGKLARAALFIALGFIVIDRRHEVLELVALFAGVYALYYGLSELVWLAVPQRPAVVRARTQTWRFRGWIMVRAGAALGLVVFMLGGAIVTWQAFQTSGGSAVAVEHVSKCNGHEELCDRRLDEVTLLGSHNAMSAASSRGWYYAEHLTGIRSQLQSGVRALLIDTWYGYDTGRGVRTSERDFVASKIPPEVYDEETVAAARRLAVLIGGVPDEGGRPGTFLCHNFCELGAIPLVQALSTINTFLDENPNEVVVLFIQDQISPEDTAKAFIASELVNRVYHPVAGEPLPTLREMIEQDERVVVLAENDPGEVEWYLPGFEYVQETPFLATSPGQLTCAPGRGQPDSPLFQMNHWITRPQPRTSDAELLNSFDYLLQRAQECEQERGRRINMINVNFSEIGDALDVVEVLNGFPRPEE